MRYVLISLPVILLIACGSTQREAARDGHSQATYRNDEIGYAVDIPPELSDWGRFVEGDISGPTFGSPVVNQGRAISMNIYHTAPYPNCDRIGVIHPAVDRVYRGIHTVWGRAEEFAASLDWKKPNCALEDGYGNALYTGAYHSSYVFCSDKKGKSVYICLSQVTDSPVLAERIFSTFRWFHTDTRSFAR